MRRTLEAPVASRVPTPRGRAVPPTRLLPGVAAAPDNPVHRDLQRV